MNNGRVVEGSGLGLTLTYYARFCFDGLRKTIEIRTEYLPKYKSEALLLERTFSVEKIQQNVCKPESGLMEPIFIETMYQFPRIQSENERTIKEMKKE
jgi:hypothetical protein